MSEFGFYSISAELASLDQLKKSFFLIENYFEILVGSQVSDRCPLGYLFLRPCRFHEFRLFEKKFLILVSFSLYVN